MANVGYATLQIIPSAKGFQAALAGQTAPAMTAVGATGGKSAGKGFAAGVLGSVKGIAGPMAAIFGAQAAFGFFKSAVSEASDLAEAGNKLQVVFGGATGSVERFAASGARSLGLSSLAAQNAAATFGIYGKAAGLAGKENAAFSTRLVGLSADLASFYNASPEEAIQAIGSALRGEAEPLRRFGVLLDDASLRAEAVRLGLVKTTKDALTPQNKILAANALIMKQTAVAQGDFSRTSGGLANQQRILSAQWANMKGTLGSALLPVITKVVTGLNNMLTGAGPLGGAMRRIGQGAKGLFDLVVKGDFTTAFREAFGVAEDSPLVDTILRLRKGAIELAGAIRAQAGPMLRSLARTFTATILPAVTSTAAFLAATVLPVLRDVGGIIKAHVLPILLSFGRFLVTQIIPAVARIAVEVGQRLRPVLSAVAGALRQYVLPALSQLLDKFREHLPAIQAVIAVVVKVVGAVLKFAAAILGKVLPPVIKFAGFLIGVLFKAIGLVITIVVKVITWIVKLGKAIWDAALVAARFTLAVRQKFMEALAFVRSLPGRITAALGRLGSLLLSKGRDLITGLLSGITARFPGVTGFLSGIGSRVIGAVRGAGSWLWSAGRDLIAGFINGIRSMAGSVIGAIRSTITDALPSYVKRALGISSPSRVFMQLGQWTGAGFALGVQRSAGAAQAAISRVIAPPSARSFGSPALAGAGAAGGGASVRVYIGDRELTDIVRTEVDDRNSRAAHRANVGRR